MSNEECNYIIMRSGCFYESIETRKQKDVLDKIEKKYLA